MQDKRSAPFFLFVNKSTGVFPLNFALGSSNICFLKQGHKRSERGFKPLPAYAIASVCMDNLRGSCSSPGGKPQVTY